MQVQNFDKITTAGQEKYLEPTCRRPQHVIKQHEKEKRRKERERFPCTQGATKYKRETNYIDALIS